MLMSLLVDEGVGGAGRHGRMQLLLRPLKLLSLAALPLIQAAASDCRDQVVVLNEGVVGA